MSEDKDPLKNLAKKFEEEEKLNTNPYQQPKEPERVGLKTWLGVLAVFVIGVIGFYIFVNFMATCVEPYQ